MERYIYPAVFDPCEEGGYCITFPDLPGIVTEGETVEDSLSMAKEALELHLYGMEGDGDEIPTPINPSKINAPPGGFVSMVEAFMPLFREKMANESVSTTVTMPRWLKGLADKKKINFSHVLQSGLKDCLGVYDYRQLKQRK
jgi:predicted RNase H-like HicB family nuclease